MSQRPELVIRDLHVRIEDREIVKGLNLTVRGGEIHALMGPNGSGKTTLSKAIMGHPAYEVTGEVLLDGVNLLELPPDERARHGLFLAFQYPVEVPGVTVANFLRTALNSIRGEEIGVWEFQEMLLEKMQLLEMDESFAGRYLNEGFSGGEKKRNEMLQLALLQPRIAVLDETDSGLDVDALKIVGKTVNSMRSESFGALIITHYNRILKHIRPDVVHIMVDGRIVRTGGPELADEVEEKGYDWVRAQVA
ncbi:Fe-S cluster assembly ATPase SufC [Caldinitratiruptor microaerophilus]|uniref:ABC transporter ATP-binding protein n=1 Tax=Caldinitratiruptor microaerophilus TaxID=671077 RepID=A0AA35CLT0_9FIRM|nr:Fe-S cluster assembly ATPase SufC [Caldinitratiruptor microaerophilus]BDG61492.1 ABC transporter ATP-binding protein [Caldinitratiruptor microaerophilus]